MPEVCAAGIMALLGPDTLAKLDDKVDVVALMAAADVLAPVTSRPYKTEQLQADLHF